MSVRQRHHLLILLSLHLATSACAKAPAKAPGPPPSPLTDSAATRISPVDAHKRAAAPGGMVTSASAAASDAGVAMLRAGGNAVDAAVATAFALGVVEPQMSGLGGSGAAMLWLAGEARPVYLDFYAAQFVESWRGSAALTRATIDGQGPPDLRAVGIPGAVAGLLTLLERHGTLPRAQVLAPAIALAENGFPVGKILADFIADNEPKLKPYPGAMALYFPGGRPLQPGAVLRNSALAASLRRIAADGTAGFYDGPIAAEVRAVMNAGGHPATTRDFSEYAPQWKTPLCTDYRGLAVLSAPPPQTGMRVLHTLELLEPFDLKALGLPIRSAPAFDVLTSALRAGQAGAGGNGDPNWASIPARGVSSSAFAQTRRALVGTGKAMAMMEAADASAFETQPAPASCPALGGPSGLPISGPAQTTDASDPAGDSNGETTHLSVVDATGNAVALTVTNSSVWGSGAYAGGFFLNDSGFRFTEANIKTASRSPWRIRTTTIAPTIVLKDRSVQMVIGAPGAGRIPSEIVQVMVYALDYGLDPLDAVRMPRIFASAGDPRVQVEQGFSPEILRDVRAMGYQPVAESSGYARLYLIVRRGDEWIGVADPRHDGEPRGFGLPTVPTARSVRP
jgi:gamma-glutamyltranspeptidase/glutathione hydrolase